MDTLIERKKRFTPRRIYGGAGVLFILVFVFYFIFRDTGSSMTIDKSRITIATVTENEFNDYIRVIGQVLPSRMIYLDAIEGGRVEERLHEEGAMVKKGDAILRLSNPLLNIGIMQSEADLAYQENELRQYGAGTVKPEAGPYRYAERISYKETSLRAIQAADGGAIDSEGGLSPGYGGV